MNKETGENHRLYNASSLEDLVVNFICQNVESVESLVGFPSIVAEKIVDKCLKNFHVCYTDEQKSAAFHLFVTAYPSEMLTKFKFEKDEIRFLYFYSDFLNLNLQNLVDLDLSNCDIVDSDFLSNLGSLHSLQKLNLSKNRLSDSAVRKLLTPFRICKDAFGSLQIFDIRGNPLSINNLKTILNFRNLVLLRFSFPILNANSEKPTRFAFQFKAKSSKDSDIENIVKTKEFKIIQSSNTIECSDDTLFVSSSGRLSLVLREWISVFNNSRVPNKTNNPYKITKKSDSEESLLKFEDYRSNSIKLAKHYTARKKSMTCDKENSFNKRIHGKRKFTEL